jgi:hypothetical protein
MQTDSTRRFELGLPLFQGLDLAAIQEAENAMVAETTKAKAEGRAPNPDPKSFMALLGALAKAADGRTIRRLSAIWNATEDQLKEAESNPEAMAALEEAAAKRPYSSCLKDSLDFFSGVGISWGASQGSSKPQTQEASPEAPPVGAGDASLSGV